MLQKRQSPAQQAEQVFYQTLASWILGLLRKRSLSISKALGCYPPILAQLVPELAARAAREPRCRGCVTGMYFGSSTERKRRFRMGKWLCVAMAAQCSSQTRTLGGFTGA